MKTFSLSGSCLNLLVTGMLLLAGCATAPHSTSARTQLSISISGTASALFKASYDFGGLKGTVSTAARLSPTPVLEGTIVGDGHVDVSKQDASEELTVDVYEGKNHPVHLVMRSGTEAIRIVKHASNWHVESL